MSATSDLPFQLDWDAQPLRDAWELTPDLEFGFERFMELTVETTADGATGGVLEVAAAEGINALSLRARGLDAFILEPSPAMLERARARQRATNTSVPLVRAVAEASPFRDGAFDRVLCDSALDHLADPERAIAEMARITAPSGRLVLTCGNYGGVTVRASRFLYRIARGLHLAPAERERHLFWDTPVPYEHTFECTLENVSAMCRPYLELERAVGVSLGCRFPGWARLLKRRPALRGVLPWLDRLAARHPGLADFMVLVWRPRPRTQWPPPDELRVRPTNPVYQRLARLEAEFWERAPEMDLAAMKELTAPVRNAAYTGDPARSWLADLVARGPFRDVAVLGCDDEPWDAAWLRAGGSERVDLYDFSEVRMARARSRLGALARRVRCVRADLNFVELPEGAYDLVWSSGCLHGVINLEHLYTQVARALRPGGLFALQGYVGEPRLQYAPARLARANAVLKTVPARYRRVDVIKPADAAWDLSPFQAVRSHEVLPLARARFDVVHEASAARLFPLLFAVDLAAIAGDDPALLARLLGAEEEVHADAVMTPCAAYLVLRG